MHLRRQSSTRSWQLPIDSGMSLRALHDFIDNRFKELRFPNWEGRTSRTLQSSRTSSSRLERLQKLSGKSFSTLLWWPVAPPKTRRFKLRGGNSLDFDVALETLRTLSVQLILPTEFSNRLRKTPYLIRVSQHNLKTDNFEVWEGATKPKGTKR